MIAFHTPSPGSAIKVTFVTPCKYSPLSKSTFVPSTLVDLCPSIDGGITETILGIFNLTNHPKNQAVYRHQVHQ
ncbi:hypothetical protein EAH57_15070 [Acinetobacter sp. 2JN-4]|nr:hypothetical protein EAH57_15070 [Acinetobacter sp. 2JN-4]